jgi:hypothetical protein
MASKQPTKEQKHHPDRESDKARMARFYQQTGLSSKVPGSAKARRAAMRKKTRR